MISRRVATFNVYNLARAGTPLYEKPGRTSGEMEDKRNWLARTLQSINADVVAFQEIFHQSELKKVLRVAAPKATLIARDESLETTTTPNVALATTLPVKAFEFIAEIPTAGALLVEAGAPVVSKFARPVLHVVIDMGPCDVHFFVVHLKSQRGELLDGEEWSSLGARALARARALALRGAEAAAVRTLVLERASFAPAIVLGDFNDDERSVTTRIITDDPQWTGVNDANPPDPTAMYSVRDLAPTPAAWPTHRHRGRWESLDHLLVSSHFCGTSTALGAIGSVDVVTTHLHDGGQPGGLTSDHAPLYADIAFRD